MSTILTNTNNEKQKKKTGNKKNSKISTRKRERKKHTHIHPASHFPLPLLLFVCVLLTGQHECTSSADCLFTQNFPNEQLQLFECPGACSLRNCADVSVISTPALHSFGGISLGLLMLSSFPMSAYCDTCFCDRCCMSTGSLSSFPISSPNCVSLGIQLPIVDSRAPALELQMISSTRISTPAGINCLAT